MTEITSTLVTRPPVVLRALAPLALMAAIFAWLDATTAGAPVARRSLRIFADGQGKMNRSIAECGGAVLVVSQFTLYGDCRRGNRPSFTEAASPDHAERLYRVFVERLSSDGLRVATGRFQAHMRVTIHNDGPVTFVIENS